jgi:cell pole-organizing protein PopZ
MRYLSRISVSSFRRYLEIMSPTNPLLKDGPMPQPSPHEPLMEETLASIRRIIADDQALLASESGLRGEAPRPDPNGEAFEPGSRAGAGRSFVSTATCGSVGAAFNALLASRFIQHRDVVIGLTREMLRPMLKTWLDDNLPGIVERLVSAEIERVTRGE